MMKKDIAKMKRMERADYALSMLSQDRACRLAWGGGTEGFPWIRVACVDGSVAINQTTGEVQDFPFKSF